ncbi:MAG: hypothetical protein VW547_07330 [Alphaproteobacteria bacterium]
MPAARRQVQALGGGSEELAALWDGRSDLVQQVAVGAGVDTDIGLKLFLRLLLPLFAFQCIVMVPLQFF